MYQLAADRIDWDALEAIAFDETEPFERKRHDSATTPLFTVGTILSKRMILQRCAGRSICLVNLLVTQRTPHGSLANLMSCQKTLL